MRLEHSTRRSTRTKHIIIANNNNNMSSQQKSLLIDSPTSPDNAVVGSLAGAKRTLAHDAPEGSAVIGTNDATATAKFASV